MSRGVSVILGRSPSSICKALAFYSCAPVACEFFEFLRDLSLLSLYKPIFKLSKNSCLTYLVNLSTFMVFYWFSKLRDIAFFFNCESWPLTSSMRLLFNTWGVWERWQLLVDLLFKLNSFTPLFCKLFGIKLYCITDCVLLCDTLLSSTTAG